MNRDELHPADDLAAPGAFSTLGLLHHQVEHYIEKREELRAAEERVKKAEAELLQLRMEFTWAKRNLTSAIENAYVQTQEAEKKDAAEKQRILEASLDIPLPPPAPVPAVAVYVRDEQGCPVEFSEKTQDCHVGCSLPGNHGPDPCQVPTNEPRAAYDHPSAHDPFGGDRPF